jgi:hypothetical protein
MRQIKFKLHVDTEILYVKVIFIIITHTTWLFVYEYCLGLLNKHEWIESLKDHSIYSKATPYSSTNIPCILYNALLENHVEIVINIHVSHYLYDKVWLKLKSKTKMITIRLFTDFSGKKYPTVKSYTITEEFLA